MSGQSHLLGTRRFLSFFGTQFVDKYGKARLARGGGAVAGRGFLENLPVGQPRRAIFSLRGRMVESRTAGLIYCPVLSCSIIQNWERE